MLSSDPSRRWRSTLGPPLSIHNPPSAVSFHIMINHCGIDTVTKGYRGGKLLRRESTHLVFGRQRGKAWELAEKYASNARHTVFPPWYPSTQQSTNIKGTRSSKDTREGGLVLEIRRSAIPPRWKHGNFGSTFTTPRKMS